MTSLHADEAFLGHYQFSHDPFAPRVPGFKFFPAQRKPVLGQLHHLARYSQLLLLVTGPLGSGKTLLRQALVASTNKDAVLSVVISARTAADETSLLRQVAQGLSINQASLEAILTKVAQLAITGQDVYLMVDDAEQLQDSALEVLLLLASGTNEGRLHVFLFGEPSLLPRLEVFSEGEERFHAIELQPYSEEETRDYLAQRLEGAGQGIELISNDLLVDIHEQSEGWPGAINQVARDALIEAMLANRGRSAQGNRRVFQLAQEASGDSCGRGHRRDRRLVHARQEQAGGAADRLYRIVHEWWYAGPGPAAGQRPGRGVQRLQPAVAATVGRRVAAGHSRAAGPGRRARWRRRRRPAVRRGAAYRFQLGSSGDAAGQQRRHADASGAAGADRTDRACGDPTPAQTPAPAAPVASAPASKPAPAPAKPAASKPATTAAAKPAPAPAAKPASGGGAGSQWYRNQSGGNFALQILGTGSEANAQAFIRQQGGGDFRYFKKTLQGKPFYVVTYGSFPNRAAALAAVKKLPSKVQAGKPWPRTFASIQQEIGQAH
ncbi:Type II secretory pathway protein [Pseudomonas aeruginosa]|nr:Type II secretory pathway protein [Pseudomonas aeruginosa]